MTRRNQILFRVGFILIPIIIFALYGIFIGRNFLIGPEIIMESPQNGITVSDPYLEIKGLAKNISLLYINGRQIFTDKKGEFKENLLLAKGYNILQIEARDKFNREVKIKREIVLK